MILDSMTLDNFRQYYGQQRLQFARGNKQNITVLHGVNGAGKTSLFLALNWCLYGEGVDNVGELISKEAISRAKVNEQVQTTVELTFFHEGERYLVRRILSGRKQKNGTCETESEPTFTMLRTGADGQSLRVTNPIRTINTVLPSNVRTYFFFDGEKIDNFARAEAAKEVKDAIYLIFKLEILDRAKRHLEETAKRNRSKLREYADDELKKLIRDDEKARAERKKTRERCGEIEEAIVSAQKKIKDISARLREMENVKPLQQRRDDLNEFLQYHREELNKVTVQIRDLASGGHFATAYPAIEKALHILQEKRKRGELPSGIREPFVKDLIEQMKCICERPITNGSPEHNQLLVLLKSQLPSKLEDNVMNTQAALLLFKERVESHRQDLDHARQQRSSLIEEINSHEAELDEIQNQLKGSPLEEVRKLEAQRAEFQADIDRYNLDKGGLVERIKTLSQQIEKLDKQISQAKKEESQAQFFEIKMDLAQKAADSIDDMYDRFADANRRNIETKTREIFKRLAWKENHFQDVLLDENFNLEVIDRYGTPSRSEFSAGERQILSLSFITAMSRISDGKAPLVMDTPFGRLSSQHRNNITEHLPDLSEQLVLFVTDEELRGQARKNLKARIGAEYSLNFDHDTSCTEIIEDPR